MQEKIWVTVLTPTYNRRKEIESLYHSLKIQTSFAFQWLVIDDGSVDGTQEYFEKILKNDSDSFDIEYYYKENGGKHTALNYSHPYIKGEVVAVVDSDDVLKIDAIETIIDYWKNCKDKDIVMMIFQKGKLDNPQEGLDNSIKEDELLTDMITLVNQGMRGDHFETVKAEWFKYYPFPVFEGERFIGEAWLWQNIGKHGKTLWVNKVIYLSEYLEGGLTKSGRSMRIKNPMGGMEHAKIFLNPKYKLSIRLKNALLYVCYGKFADKKNRELICDTKADMIVILQLFPGILLHNYWKWKYY